MSNIAGRTVASTTASQPSQHSLASNLNHSVTTVRRKVGYTGEQNALQPPNMKGRNTMFDYTREKPTVLGGFGNINMTVDESGEVLDVPCRMILADDERLLFELGPYSMTADQARELRDVLIEYLARMKWSEA